MIKLFVIQQTFAVFLLTQFLSIKIYIIAQISWAVLFILYGVFIFKKSFLESLLLWLLWIFIACLSVYISFDLKTQYWWPDWAQKQTKIQWEIVASRKDNVYILKDEYKLYILRNTNEKLHFGSKIFVKWQMSTTTCEVCLSIFNNWKISRPVFWVFDYDIWRRKQWIYWDIYSKEFIQSKKNESPFYKLKNHLISQLQYWFQDTSKKGLFSWMLFGDISMLDKENYDLFVSSWLVHLVAVSWGNLIFLVLICMYWFFRLPYYLRIFLVALVVIFYSLLVWLDSSVFRAVIMWLLLLSSRLVWRKNNIHRTLLLWWSILLLLEPYNLLYDLGFLLSFSALWWILLFWNLYQTLLSIKPLYKIFEYILNYIIPSIGAFFWTFPILVFYIWTLNITSILWNVLVIPAILPIMLWWLFVIMLPINSLVAKVFIYVVNILIEYVFMIANLVSAFALTITSDLYSLRVVLACVWLLFLFGCTYLSQYLKRQGV